MGCGVMSNQAAGWLTERYRAHLGEALGSIVGGVVLTRGAKPLTPAELLIQVLTLGAMGASVRSRGNVAEKDSAAAELPLGSQGSTR